MTGAEIVILVVEIIGTVVFAFSGILVAMEKRLDFFGIGLLALHNRHRRGNHPRFGAGQHTARGISLACVFNHRYFYRSGSNGAHPRQYRLCAFRAVFIAYAAGYVFGRGRLGAFCVVGVRTCLQMGYGDNVYLVVFVGMITGVGGGMLRDMMVSRTPQILRREIYATAAIIGSLLYYYLRMLIPDMAAFFTSALAVIAIRLLSIKFHINMPKPAKK